MSFDLIAWSVKDIQIRQVSGAYQLLGSLKVGGALVGIMNSARMG